MLRLEEADLDFNTTNVMMFKVKYFVVKCKFLNVAFLHRQDQQPPVYCSLMSWTP